MAALYDPRSAFAATAACVTGPLPSFLPNRLTVDCASRQNFRLFRQDSKSLGLTGVVSMTAVRGKLGSYEAGNLFLFPWIKPKAPVARLWASAAPASLSQALQAAPIPNATLPLDEYFCRIVLVAPTVAFIGFSVDTPHEKSVSRRPWTSNVEKLADGAGVGIGWDSAGLNAPWFGGSRWIPHGETCNGKAWRKLIVEGLQQASVPAC